MKPLSGRGLARVLEAHGWALARVRGSHHVYTRPGSIVRLSVPFHGNKPLKPGLQSHLLKMAGIEEE